MLETVEHIGHKVVIDECSTSSESPREDDDYSTTSSLELIDDGSS